MTASETTDAVRRHTLPREDPPAPEVLADRLQHAARLRSETRYLELLRELPTLLGQATATALRHAYQRHAVVLT